MIFLPVPEDLYIKEVKKSLSVTYSGDLRGEDLEQTVFKGKIHEIDYPDTLL